MNVNDNDMDEHETGPAGPIYLTSKHIKPNEFKISLKSTRLFSLQNNFLLRVACI